MIRDNSVILIKSARCLPTLLVCRIMLKKFIYLKFVIIVVFNLYYVHPAFCIKNNRIVGILTIDCCALRQMPDVLSRLLLYAGAACYILIYKAADIIEYL